MVRAGCVFVAGIHPSRTWTSGSFESVRWNACVHRLDSHPKEFLGEWSLHPCLLQRKYPLYRKISPEEDRTREAVDSKPKHYQCAIPLFRPPGKRFEQCCIDKISDENYITIQTRFIQQQQRCHHCYSYNIFIDADCTAKYRNIQN